MKSSTVQRVLFLLIPVNKDLKQIHIWERQKYCQFRLIKTFRKVLFYSTVLGNRTIYGSWDMKCTRQNCFAILGHFLLFYSPNSLKNKSLKKYLKKKKTPGDIIILHKCTKNHNHRLYRSWDMARDGCNCYFSFWAILFHFTSSP